MDLGETVGKFLFSAMFPNIMLIAAQKNYVLDAPLGDGPIAGADADVMNILASSV